MRDGPKNLGPFLAAQTGKHFWVAVADGNGREFYNCFPTQSDYSDGKPVFSWREPITVEMADEIEKALVTALQTFRELRQRWPKEQATIVPFQPKNTET